MLDACCVVHCYSFYTTHHHPSFMHSSSRIFFFFNINFFLPSFSQGVCSFAEKAWHAQEAGALAAFIYDSDRTNDNRWVDMVRDQDSYEVTIPAMFVLGREGYKIVEGIAAAHTHSATISIPVNETHVSPHEYFPGVLW